MSVNLKKDKKQTPAQRIPLTMGIEYRRSYARQPDRGRLKNISLTGAFLETNSDGLTPEDKVVITFQVSGRRREISAKIVWKNAKGCGVEFKPFNNRDVQIVDDLIYFVEDGRESRRNVLDDIFKRVA